MGMTKVNDKQVVAPSSQMKVEDLKELAGVPEHDVLYDPNTGKVLDDQETVPTDHHNYGVVTDWQRG